MKDKSGYELFTDEWYKSLNSEFKWGSEGAYRDEQSHQKIARAVRRLLRETGKSLTVNEILDIIDKKRYHNIFAGYLGDELRDLQYGIEYTYLEQPTKKGDVYRYKYIRDRSTFVDTEGNRYRY